MKKGFVILNYNDYQSTSKLLDQINVKERDALFCVVDNCSTDNSYELLKKYETHNCHVVKNEENRGYAAGNNVGCRYLINNYRIDIIFILNPDVEFEWQMVDRIVEIFIQQPEYQVLTPVMTNINGKISTRPYIRIPTYMQDVLLCFYMYNRLYEKTHSHEIDWKKEIVCVDAAPGSFFAIRATALKEIGFLDEGTFLFYEEMSLAMRLKQKNAAWKIGLVTKEKYVHHHSVSIRNSLSIMNSYRIYMRSKLYFEMKYHHIGIFRQQLLKIAIMISCAEEWIMLYVCKKK